MSDPDSLPAFRSGIPPRPEWFQQYGPSPDFHSRPCQRPGRVSEVGPVEQPSPEFKDALIQAQVAANNTFIDNLGEREKFAKLPYEERMKPANKPPQMPWMAIVEKLVELGWAPPVSAPEAAQN